MKFYELALQERDQLTQRIHELEDIIRAAPEGSLVRRRSGNQYKYYQQISNYKQSGKVFYKYIKKKEGDLLFALAQKSIWKSSLQEFKDQLNIINQYISAYNALPAHTLQSLVQSEKLRQIIIENNPYRSINPASWSQDEYEKNPRHPENLIVPTASGIYVRSKSEALIAFGLDMHKIPYRYECKLQLGHREFYPDFTILHPDTGRIIIWEHFGMMDQHDYLRKASAKMNMYIQNGYYPNENLIVTFETPNRPLGSAKVSWVINNLILQSTQ